MKRIEKTYILVMNAGSEEEEIVREFYGTRMAYQKADELRSEYPETTFDVMKRTPDGTLTTDF